MDNSVFENQFLAFPPTLHNSFSFFGTTTQINSFGLGLVSKSPRQIPQSATSDDGNERASNAAQPTRRQSTAHSHLFPGLSGASMSDGVVQCGRLLQLLSPQYVSSKCDCRGRPSADFKQVRLLDIESENRLLRRLIHYFGNTLLQVCRCFHNKYKNH